MIQKIKEYKVSKAKLKVTHSLIINLFEENPFSLFIAKILGIET